MAKVYMLGAGASRAVIPTAPLMDNLLPDALEILERRLDRREGQGHQRIRRLRRFINTFYLYQSANTRLTDKRNELPRLEDILSQLDLAILEDRPLARQYDIASLRSLRDDLVFALCEVLKEKLENEATEAEGEYGHNLMWNFLAPLTPNDAIISLNYDIIVDFALVQQAGQIDYGIPFRYEYNLFDKQARKPAHHRIIPPSKARETVSLLEQGTFNGPLYKPHGSLNWIYCPICQEIDMMPTRKAASYLFDERYDYSCPDCGGKYEPLIITPTLLKAYDNLLLNQIWRLAENKVTEADELVFVGYSLADADIQLRCMLKRAIYANRSKSHVEDHMRHCTIRVIGREDGQQGDALHERYRQLFRQVIYEPIGFQQYIEREFQAYMSARAQAVRARNAKA